MSIYTKLHEIQKSIRGFGKDKKSFGYDYVSGNKVLAIVRPLMDKHRLILKQEVIEIENTKMMIDFLYKESKFKEKSKEDTEENEFEELLKYGRSTYTESST